jgi:hypothetical protein
MNTACGIKQVMTQFAPPGPDDLVMVPVYLRARQAPVFQAALPFILARLDTDPLGAYTPTAIASAPLRDAWTLEDWDSVEDRAAAAWIVEDLASRQLRVVAAQLAAAPEPGATTSELLAQAGYDSGTHPSPVFKALVSRFRRVGRRPIWTGGPHTPTGQRLPVPDGPGRELFTEAIRARWPGLAIDIGLTVRPPEQSAPPRRNWR